MTVYLAGKISGDEEYIGKFSFYKKLCEKLYDIVLNPAEFPEGMTPEDYMSICIQMIFRADAVLFLPDWKESEGAKLEHQLCKYIGKQVMYLK